MALRRLGQIFVDLGFITDDQLEMLVEEQSQNQGTLIGRVASDMGLITDEQLVQALGEQFNLKPQDIEGFTPPKEVLELLSDAMAKLYRVIPLQLHNNVLTLGTCDPQNLSMQDELRRFLGHDIRLVVCTESQILKGIDKFYDSESDSIEKIISDLEDDNELKQASEALSQDGPINLSDVNELVESAPVRKLLNMVCCWRSRITPAIFTLNHSKTNFASASKPTGFCLRWFLRRVTWPLRSQRDSKSWPI